MSSLAWLRVQTLAIGVGGAMAQPWLAEYGRHGASWLRVVAHCASYAVIPLAIAAFAVCLSSLFEVHVLPDGRVCYAENNWLWRALINLGVPRRVSLCRMYWTTALVMAAFWLFSVWLFLAVQWLVSMITHPPHAPSWQAVERDLSHALPIALAVAAVALVLFLLLRYVLPRWCRQWAFSVGMCCWLLFLVVWLPLSDFHYIRRQPWGAALAHWAVAAGEVVAWRAVAFCLLFAAWKLLAYLWPALRRTWWWQMLLALKGNLCPVLTECGLDVVEAAKAAVAGAGGGSKQRRQLLRRAQRLAQEDARKHA